MRALRRPKPEARLLQPPEPGRFGLAELEGLPEPVRRHLGQAIAPGTPLATCARLRMRGRIKVGRGQELFIIPGQPDRKVWWRNLRRPSPVRLRLRGRDLEGTATASSDPEAIAAGLHRYLARYPKAAKGPWGSTGRQRRLVWHGPGGSSAGRGHPPPKSSLAVDAPLPRTCLKSPLP